MYLTVQIDEERPDRFACPKINKVQGSWKFVLKNSRVGVNVHRLRNASIAF